MRIIAIDPGVMSGYCYATLEGEPTKLTYHPFQSTDDVDDLWRRLVKFQPKYAIIEDFEFRRGKMAAGGLNLFPQQLIGIARLYGLMASSQCTVFIQKAAQGKSYYTDPMLKQLGLHKRGIPHGMDASRHLLHWAMFGFGNQFIGSKSTEDFAEITDNMNFWEDGN